MMRCHPSGASQCLRLAAKLRPLGEIRPGRRSRSGEWVAVRRRMERGLRAGEPARSVRTTRHPEVGQFAGHLVVLRANHGSALIACFTWIVRHSEGGRHSSVM